MSSARGLADFRIPEWLPSRGHGPFIGAVAELANVAAARLVMDPHLTSPWEGEESHRGFGGLVGKVLDSSPFQGEVGWGFC